MALGRKQHDDTGNIYYGSGGPNEYGRTPPPPPGQRYVRDLDAARRNAIRASVRAYEDSGLAVPAHLAAQAEGLGDEMQPEVKLESDSTELEGRPFDPFAPGNAPVPPLEPKPIDWSGQGHLEPTDQTEAPTPPGPVSARAQATAETQPPVAAETELTQIQAETTPEPVVEPAAPVDEALGLPTGTPMELPADMETDDLVEAKAAEPVSESAPVVEAKPEPVVEKAPEQVVEAPKPEPAPEPAKPVAAARKAAAKKAPAKPAQRK